MSDNDAYQPENDSYQPKDEYSTSSNDPVPVQKDSDVVEDFDQGAADSSAQLGETTHRVQLMNDC
jgi:hypothetical protein